MGCRMRAKLVYMAWNDCAMGLPGAECQNSNWRQPWYSSQGSPSPKKMYAGNSEWAYECRGIAARPPLLSQSMERGHSVLHRMPHLATMHRRVAVAGLLVLLLAIHSVTLADVA